MWLPKDERKLLSYYYRRINKVETSQNFEMKDLIKVFGEYIFKPLKLSSEVVLCRYKLLENINNLLSRRGLIKWENLNPIAINTLQESPRISEALGWTESTNVNFRITLTIEGYDLGRKYNSWWSSSGLWFAEYKDHWFWLILGFLGGIIGALIVNWLSDGC
jgi:hypothetical protein